MVHSGVDLASLLELTLSSFCHTPLQESSHQDLASGNEAREASKSGPASGSHSRE